MDKIEIGKEKYAQIEKELLIGNALSIDYKSVCLVDFDSDKMYPYRTNSVIDEHYGEYYRTNPKYEELILDYINNRVVREDQNEMIEVVKYENLKKRLSQDKYLVHDYRILLDGKPCYFRMKIVNVSKKEGLHQAVFGFANINSHKVNELGRYYYTDPVTGGDNYNRFKELVKEKNKSGYLITLDIYSFKIINSTCGVEKGDEALRGIWDALETTKPEGCVAAHINADHFVMFDPVNDKDLIIKNLDKLNKKFSELSDKLKIPNIIPYYGMAFWEPGNDIEDTYGCATIARHMAKKKHDTNCELYTEEVAEKIELEKKMTDSFDEAIKKGLFEVWYQPKYSPQACELVGAEALVRWKIGNQVISPGVFIPFFEKNGLIHRLDEYMFRKVCTQQKEWEKEGKRIVPVSINLSRNSLYYSNLADLYSDIVKEIGLETKFVPLEITESAAVSNTEIRNLTDAFYAKGFYLHLDDFGAGYSSLSTLNQLHFSTLKLDKSLIDFIGNYGGDKLLEHTIALAKDLGLHVTAEGVEDENQVNFLKQLQCDSIQGYFYSKPLPADEFVKVLDESKRYFGEANRNLFYFINQNACDLSEVVRTIIDSAYDYAVKNNVEIIKQPMIYTEKVYMDKEKFLSMMKDISEYIIDQMNRSGSLIFTCYRKDDAESKYRAYYFRCMIINGANQMGNFSHILERSQKIIDAHENLKQMGGSLEVDIDEEGNLFFTARIPLIVVKESLDMSSRYDINENIANIIKGKVLLVDDNELNRFLSKEILTAAGFTIEAVESGDKAIQSLREHAPNYYTLVIMDIAMPQKDGYQTTKEIREDEREDIRNIPIVALSSNTKSADIRKSLKYGMSAHVAKPIDIEFFMDAIKNL